MENEQIKQKFPIGMILILMLVSWGGLVTLNLLFRPLKTSLLQLGPVLIGGSGSIIVNLATFGILATIFYGILKKMKWARKLAIGWYVFSVLLALVNLVSFLGNKTMYDSYYPPKIYPLMTPAVIISTLVFALMFGSIISLFIIIYLLRKKDFFVN